MNYMYRLHSDDCCVPSVVTHMHYLESEVMRREDKCTSTLLDVIAIFPTNRCCRQ